MPPGARRSHAMAKNRNRLTAQNRKARDRGVWEKGTGQRPKNAVNNLIKVKVPYHGDTGIKLVDRWINPNADITGGPQGRRAQTQNSNKSKSGGLLTPNKAAPHKTATVSAASDAKIKSLEKTVHDLASEHSKVAKAVDKMQPKNPFEMRQFVDQKFRQDSYARLREHNSKTAIDAIEPRKNLAAMMPHANGVNALGIIHTNKGLDSPIDTIKDINKNTKAVKLKNGVEGELTLGKKAVQKMVASELAGLSGVAIPKTGFGKFGMSEEIGQSQILTGTIEQKVNGKNLALIRDNYSDFPMEDRQQLNNIAMFDTLMGISRHDDSMIQRPDGTIVVTDNVPRGGNISAGAAISRNNTKYSQSHLDALNQLSDSAIENLAKRSKKMSKENNTEDTFDAEGLKYRRDMLKEGIKKGLTVSEIADGIDAGVERGKLKGRAKYKYSPEQTAHAEKLIKGLSKFAHEVDFQELLDTIPPEHAIKALTSIHDTLQDVYAKTGMAKIDSLKYSSDPDHKNNGQFSDIDGKRRVIIGEHSYNAHKERLSSGYDFAVAHVATQLMDRPLDRTPEGVDLADRIKTVEDGIGDYFTKGDKQELRGIALSVIDDGLLSRSGEPMWGTKKSISLKDRVKLVEEDPTKGYVHDEMDDPHDPIPRTVKELDERAQAYHGKSEAEYVSEQVKSFADNQLKEGIIAKDAYDAIVKSPDSSLASAVVGSERITKFSNRYYMEALVGKKAIDDLNTSFSNYTDTLPTKFTQEGGANWVVFDKNKHFGEGLTLNELKSGSPARMAETHTSNMFDDPYEGVTRHEFGHAFHSMYLSDINGGASIIKHAIDLGAAKPEDATLPSDIKAGLTANRTPEIEDRARAFWNRLTSRFAVSQRAMDNSSELMAEAFTAYTVDSNSVDPAIKSVFDNVSYKNLHSDNTPTGKFKRFEASAKAKPPEEFIPEHLTPVDHTGKPMDRKAAEEFIRSKVPDYKSISPRWQDMKVNTNYDVDPTWVAKGTVPSKDTTTTDTIIDKAEVDRRAAVREEGRVERFARVKQMREDMPSITKALEADVEGGSHEATAALTMALTGLRIGGEDGVTKKPIIGEDGKAVRDENDKVKYEHVRTYGVTSITSEHVKIANVGGQEVVQFDFLGKKAGRNVASVDNPVLVKKFKELLSTTPPGESLIKATDASTNKYLKEQKALPSNTTNKDFRTQVGTGAAISKIGDFIERNGGSIHPDQLDEFKRQVGVHAGQRLNHTDAVPDEKGKQPTGATALDNYIDPAVFDLIKVEKSAPLFDELIPQAKPKKERAPKAAKAKSTKAKKGKTKVSKPKTPKTPKTPKAASVLTPADLANLDI